VEPNRVDREGRVVAPQRPRRPAFRLPDPEEAGVTCDRPCPPACTSGVRGPSIDPPAPGSVPRSEKPEIPTEETEGFA